MHRKNRGSTRAIWTIDDYLSVESPRTEERRIEDVWSVRCCNEDDVVLEFKPIHLDEQLVERLLPFIVASAHAGAPMATDRINLVHEDDAWRRFLGLPEQISDTRCTHTDEHLDEVAAADRKERNPCLTRDGASEQRLPSSGRPVEQDTLGNARAERLKLARILQELLDLAQFLRPPQLRRQRQRT